MHILLIEDSPADIYLMQEGFAALPGDHRLSVAKSMAEALDFVREKQPDAALLDLSLPDSFGLESFQNLAQAAPELAIIILSGNSDQTMAIEAVRGGAQDYILKGDLDPATLLRTLRYAFERAAVKTALRRSESRFRRLFDSVPVGVFQMNHRGELTTANANLIETLGFDTEADLLRAARSGSLFVSKERHAETRRILETKGLLDGYDFELHHRNGDVITMLISAAVVKDDGSGHVTVEGTMLDITERKAAENRLRIQAERDELTGIANRRAFRAIADSVMAAAAMDATGTTPAVLLFDLDGFKAVNDTLGHAAGDELLRQVANQVAASLRQGDTLARIGGDEFVILCSVANRGNLEQVAAKVISVVSGLEQVDGKAVAIGASMGIAMYGSDGQDCDTLMSAADAAMYVAKKSGKGRFAFATPGQASEPLPNR